MGVKKSVLIIFVFAFIIFYSISLSSALIGVTPASYKVNFKPNLDQKFTFRFQSSEGVPIKINLEGDLENYSKLSSNSVLGNGNVFVSMKLPSEFSIPGPHYLYVSGAQQPSSGTGFAILGIIRGVVEVDVPYPGKYAEVDLSVGNANAGEKVPVKIKISSKGEDAINTNTILNIYDSSGNKVETIPFGSNSINSQESVNLEKNISTSNVPSGNYMAEAVVTYGDNKKTIVNDSFRLGRLYFKIVNYTKEVSKNKINPFEIVAESYWNDPVNGIYAKGEVLNSSINFVTASTSAKGFKKAYLRGYFDTTGIKSNPFQMNVTVYYENHTTNQIVDVYFESQRNWTLIGIIIGIIIFVIIITGLIIFFVKHGRKE